MAEPITNIRDTITIPAGCRERFLPLQSTAGKPLREHSVEIAGLSRLTPGYEVVRTAPGFHLVLYTLGGQGKLVTPGFERDLMKGDLLVGPSQSAYRYLTAGARWRILWFHLHDTRFWAHLRDTRVSVRPSYQGPEIEAAMEGLMAESLRDESVADRLALLFAEQLTLYLRREFAEETTARDRVMRQTLHDLWNHVDAHLDEPWTVSRLAARLHMSAPSFHRIALRHTGHSPLQMVFRLRMQRAEELLRNHSYPLKIVAARLGYATPFAFSNAFKRYKGISPAHYRRLNR